ncbi:MAG TPA: hypothetical protein VKG79_14755 [Bryobacteraceae bacterium]|nr:hypothetical protein [Bryobacteraceae bacterium]
MTRRDWLYLAGQTALLAQDNPAKPDPQRRIAQTIRAFEEQGIHRTATEVDRISGDWLATEVQRSGLTPARETFTISRIDPVAASLSADGRRIEGVPMFDGGFTDAVGVGGRLGQLGSDAPIGLTEIAPNATGAGGLPEARRSNAHRAIVVVTRGGRPGLCPSNSESFLHPFGPPILQVSSEEAGWLGDLARQGSEVTLIAQVNRTPAEAFNVLANIPGADRALPPLIIMTPRSGWWTCASERGGGIACWLELMRAMHGVKPARDVLFVASSGHELGQHGIEVYAERRPGLIKHSRAWIHFGANIGAAQNPGNTIQASDDEMEMLLAERLGAAGIAINRKVPRGTVPGGEAGVVHRGGGRYMSIIGSNALFHNPLDRGPDAIDPGMIARFAEVFITIAKTLAG